ncbi:MAG: hypothetical protein DCF32_00225 [Leptolyngbya sp.]|jgi:hypothetical protein|nr:MAG: hypothetical protein DCF32_00225 [Leptolyngbya sp.]
MSTSRLRMWEGKEWEKYIQRLLQMHYGIGNYQEIPDKHGGDFGIEGYSTDGCAYQCYAAQEPLSTKQRYEHQRNKITTDIGKFINNKTELVKTFGHTVINRWVLVVPLSESASLVQHASTKAKEVLDAKLSYVSDDFKIIIITDDSFKKEIQELAYIGAIDIVLPEIEVTPEDCNNWISENDGLVGRLNEKALKIPKLKPEEKRQDFISSIVSHYLRGQNSLDKFNKDYPDIYARLNNCKRTYEKQLETLSLISNNPAPQHLTEALEKYRIELENTINNLPNTTIQNLAWEGISDWLIRCPLDF